MQVSRSSFSAGLLSIFFCGVLTSCTALQKITGPSYAEIKKALQKPDCEQLLSWIQKKKVRPQDYLNIQYALKCDLSHTFEITQAGWYQSLLQELSEKRALASPGFEDDQKIWLERAQVSLQKKEKEQLYLKVIDSSPESPLALEAQTALWALSPRLSPEKEKLDPLVLAADHRAAIENQKALDIYLQQLQKTKADTERLQILEQIRQTYRSLQRKDDQLKATEQIYKIHLKNFKKNKKAFSSQYLSSGLLYGRAVWTANRPGDARKIFLEIAKALPLEINQTELQWVLGKLEDEQKNEEQAILHFTKSLSYPEGPFTNRALWSAAWLDYKMNRFAEARKFFLELAEKDPTENRARYWAARSLKKLDPELTQQAQSEFREVLDLDPMGYYGLLSQRELAVPFLPMKVPQKAPQKKALKKYLKDSEFLDLKALLEISDPATLQSAVDTVTKKVSANDLEAQYELSLLYAAGQLYLPLLIQIQKLEAQARSQLLKTHPDLLFPIDYLDVIQKIATSNQIPTEFVLSIIRQESTFNTYARSPVDALGLMQMMPKLAEKKAPTLKIEYQEPADLFKPEINIVLGIDELSDLLKRYKGSYILASAGYNASPVAIRGWLEQRHREDVTEFIEEIGYDETRSYIKLVLRNFVFYRRLLTSEPFLFPEELLFVKK